MFKEKNDEKKSLSDNYNTNFPVILLRHALQIELIKSINYIF